MRGYTRMMMLVLLAAFLVMTGCEKRYTANETDTVQTDAQESVTETETESETSPPTVKENVETEKVTEAKTPELKEFMSSSGYHILYDDTLFQYSRTGDYDEIVLKGQTFSSKPPVFFAAMKIDNDEVHTVIDEIFTDSAKETTVGQEDYPALCQPTAESQDNGRVLTHHNQYLVRLADGDALLFETQWYEEGGVDTNGRKLEAILESVVIDLPVQSQAATEEQESEQPKETQNETAETAETAMNEQQ